MNLARTILIPSLLAGALLAACSSRIETASSPSRAPQSPATGTCNASQAQFAVGQRATDELLERSRAAAGASVARYLRPGQAVTLEFLDSRLNLKLDEKDVVESATCG